MTKKYMNLFGLEEQIAFVTYGARVIGFVTCEALAEAGANVILTDVNAK